MNEPTAIDDAIRALHDAETTARMAREALTFDDCQLLFGPDVPIADQDFACRTIWPELRELLHEPDADFIGADWKE